MNVANVIGGNGFLSSAGEEYGNCLRQHIDEHVDVRSTKFVTSSLNRTRQTAKLAGINADQDANLDEISAGDFDGLTFDYVKEHHPTEYEERKRDKLGYRYPNGESYIDLIGRIRRSLSRLDFHRQDHFLVIHQAVARCVLGILLNLPMEKIPHIEVPLHTVIRIEGGEITYQKLL